MKLFLDVDGKSKERLAVILDLSPELIALLKDFERVSSEMRMLKGIIYEVPVDLVKIPEEIPLSDIMSRTKEIVKKSEDISNTILTSTVSFFNYGSRVKPDLMVKITRMKEDQVIITESLMVGANFEEPYKSGFLAIGEF
jgi:hypothetical protein